MFMFSFVDSWKFPNILMWWRALQSINYYRKALQITCLLCSWLRPCTEHIYYLRYFMFTKAVDWSQCFSQVPVYNLLYVSFNDFSSSCEPIMVPMFWSISSLGELNKMSNKIVFRNSGRKPRLTFMKKYQLI